MPIKKPTTGNNSFSEYDLPPHLRRKFNDASNSNNANSGATLPAGTNDGDVLTWDETTNTWISEIPIQSDWLQLDNTKVDYIKNKPIIESTITRFDLLPYYGLTTYTDMCTIDLNDGEVTSGLITGTMFVSDGTNTRSKTFELEFNGIREGTNYNTGTLSTNSFQMPYSLIGTVGAVTVLQMVAESSKVKFQVRCYNGTTPTVAYIDYSIKLIQDAVVVAGASLPIGTENQTLRYNASNVLESDSTIMVDVPFATDVTLIKAGAGSTADYVTIGNVNNTFGRSDISVQTEGNTNMISLTTAENVNNLSNTIEFLSRYNANYIKIITNSLRLLNGINNTGKYLKIKDSSGEVEFVDIIATNTHTGTNVLANYSITFADTINYVRDSTFAVNLLANKSYHVEFDLWIRDTSELPITRHIALGTYDSYNSAIITRFGTVEMPDINSPYNVYMVKGMVAPQELIGIDYNNLTTKFIRIKGIVTTSANCVLHLWWKNLTNTNSVQILAHSYSHVHLLD